LDCSYHRSFVPSLDFSYPGLFVVRTHLDCSYHGSQCSFSLLRFNHHSAVDKLVARQRSPCVINRVARQTSHEAIVKPPSTATYGAVSTIVVIVVIVLVECRKFHPVVTHAGTVILETVNNIVAFILQRVAGVSTVSRHFQSVFVVELVTDLE